MNVVTISKMRDNLSKTLSGISDDGAITIQKNNTDIAVLVSSKRYRELERIEDMLYKKAADLAFKEGFASEEETNKLMSKLGVNA